MSLIQRTAPDVAERAAVGRAARKTVPRISHASWAPASDRPDPIALLRAHDDDRMEDLVPIRWGRMSASPFAFYRGSAALMAADLAPLPRTGLRVQLCGDAHLSNFGLYGSPERALLFDVNDFDETLPGPFEWDLKRLAASFVLASRHNGFADAVARDTALAAARSYREHMTEYAAMRDLEVWYSRVAAEHLLDMARRASERSGSDIDRARVRAAAKGVAKVRTRDSLQAAGKLTEVVDGRRRIVDLPPLVMHFPELQDAERMLGLFRQYRSTLEDDRRALLDRYEVVDIARKVVGVGSVGTRCLIVLLLGRDTDDPLFLQVKEAGPSVLEAHLGRSRFNHAGHRVVAGQRLMQAASDIFLGWMTGKPAGRHFYWRQLRDMKGSVDTTVLRPPGFKTLPRCAAGRSPAGMPVQASASPSPPTSGRASVDQAIADFAVTYAEQAEKDHAVVVDAIKKGKIPAETGV